MRLRALLNLAAVLALAYAGIASADGGPFRIYLPGLASHSEPVRGSASCGPNNSGVIDFCFRYWSGWLAIEQTPEVVSLASTRLMAMAGYTDPLTVTHVGQWWLLFNEPDNGDVTAGDGISAHDGAIRFKQMADSIHAQGGRVACCNLLFSTGWLDQMLVEYANINGSDALAQIDAISFHDYAVLLNPGGCTTDNCIIGAWTARAQAWVTWRNQKAGAYPISYKPLWCTECAWTPWSEPDSATAIRHMQLLCAQPVLKQMSRYAWFPGQYLPQWATISLFTQDGSVSALGQTWATC